MNTRKRKLQSIAQCCSGLLGRASCSSCSHQAKEKWRYQSQCFQIAAWKWLVPSRLCGEDLNHPQPIAFEAVAAQSHRGDRELSSAAMRNRYIHHRPVQRDLRGVRELPACWRSRSTTLKKVTTIPRGCDGRLLRTILTSYQEAAEFLNFNNIDMVCLQHEYGIFGGPAGSHILHLLRRLKMPVVTTLHTVLREPDPNQLMVMEEIAELSDRLIVMSQLSSQFLQEIFKVPGSKIDMVPHGVPDLPFLDPNFYKDKFGVEGKAVLLTFGLLSPNKGIENVIRALPEILSKHKNVVYIVAGATHPHVLRREGEKYRASLQVLAKEAGVESQVIFHNRFASPEEMAEFIGAADIYITPYRHEAQVVSGTLAYALGAGKAIISTPYWHAIELLDDRRGALVPFQNPDAIAQKTIELLDTPAIRHAMRKRAYLFAREMIWKRVAQGYMGSFSRVRRDRMETPRVQFSARATPKDLNRLPELKLDHINALTDDTGVLQHAIFTVPNRGEGHTTDDNARALIFTVMLERVGKNRPEKDRPEKDQPEKDRPRETSERNLICRSRISLPVICHFWSMASILPRAGSETSLAMIADGMKLTVLKIVTDAPSGHWARFWGGRVIMDCAVPLVGYSSGPCQQLWSFTVLVPAPTRCLEFRNISIPIPAIATRRRLDRSWLGDCSPCMSRSDARIGSGLRTL